jgi:hypothetical protein
MSNCPVHPEAPAVAYCRACGKPLCQACQNFAQGTVFCSEHVPAPRATAAGGATDSPYTSPNPATNQPPTAMQPGAISPGLAFLLGLIPGVGAIYNGQYAKGLVHLIIFGLLVSISSAGSAGELQPLFGMMIPGWIAYMAFEAYHTARRRLAGEAVDEFSSVFPLRGQVPTRVPVGPVVLIGLGILFLLNNLDILHFYVLVKYWPVVLIALGGYMLYLRFTESETRPPAADATNVVSPGVSHE